MAAMAVVASLNVGAPRRVGAKAGPSGIDKVPTTDPVAVSAPGPEGSGRSGLSGDAIGDARHHGGEEQAVYAYAREDLDWWEGELGRDLRSGLFGENLTTEGIDVNRARLGETWRVGEAVLLQVTTPRIPCATFAAWMGEAGWQERFRRAARPGAYLRVLAPGTVRAGDPVLVVSRPEHGVSVERAFRALTVEPELLSGLLEAGPYLVAGLAERIRAQAGRRSDRTRGAPARDGR